LEGGDIKDGDERMKKIIIAEKVKSRTKALQGIIDRVDFNATTHGQRDIDDDRLRKLIKNKSQENGSTNF
jgi:chromosomal replication initiation ATPase DnaA